jgi:hypothetical protein
MEHFMRTLRLCAAIVVVMGMAACTGQPSPARIREPVYDLADGKVVYMDNLPTSTRTVLQKDYALGARRVARVSEPMLSVKNYTVADRVVAAVVLEDFEQPCAASRAVRSSGGSVATGRSATGGKPGHKSHSSKTATEAQAEVEIEAAEVVEAAEPAVRTVRCRDGRLSRVRGQREQRLPVGGAMREGGDLFYMVQFDAAEDGMVYLASDARGRVKAGDYLARSKAPGQSESTPLGIPLEIMSTKTPLMRDKVLFRYEVEETIDPLAPQFQHYSLMYEGTSYDHRGMVYHVLYREYRRDGSKIPLFEQSLAFAGETSTVDVLGFRIRVHDVSDKQIVYTVQRD